MGKKTKIENPSGSHHFCATMRTSYGHCTFLLGERRACLAGHSPDMEQEFLRETTGAGVGLIRLPFRNMPTVS